MTISCVYRSHVFLFYAGLNVLYEGVYTISNPPKGSRREIADRIVDLVSGPGLGGHIERSSPTEVKVVIYSLAQQIFERTDNMLREFFGCYMTRSNPKILTKAITNPAQRSKAASFFVIKTASGVRDSAIDQGIAISDDEPEVAERVPVHDNYTNVTGRTSERERRRLLGPASET